MNWIKRLFSRKAPVQPVRNIPERPSDWNLTLSDLFAEMKAGKRKYIGNPEAEWAKQYEQSLIPEGTRFPSKGDLYESKFDQHIEYLTAWAAPFTGGGEGVLFKGERIWVDNEPRDNKPLGVYALPVEYDKLEMRMVSQDDRNSSKYGGFYFYFNTIDLNKNFTLIKTGFKGKRRTRF
ncbi:MAG: hypothetical protein HQK63_09590 [Desulfamplus sp.]|nr:hypothetical protein [Desulfamplus sp.]